MHKESKHLILECVYDKIIKECGNVYGIPVINKKERENLRKELLNMYKEIEEEINNI